MYQESRCVKISKYGSKKIEYDGFVFDSKLEYNYYCYLKQLKSNGVVSNFELQPKYQLQPTFKKNGKTFRSIDYVADFLVYYADGKQEVVDVKGMITTDFAIKRKLFEYRYPELALKLVAYSKMDGGWIEHDVLKKARTKRRKERELKVNGKV